MTFQKTQSGVAQDVAVWDAVMRSISFSSVEVQRKRGTFCYSEAAPPDVFVRERALPPVAPGPQSESRGASSSAKNGNCWCEADAQLQASRVQQRSTES